MAHVKAIDKIPPEIWTQIFEIVKDESDKYSCNDTCENWRSILIESKTIWLFKLIFPSLFEHLQKQDILLLRVICKDWCSVVDEFLENIEKLQVFNGDLTRYKPYNRIHNKWKRSFGYSYVMKSVPGNVQAEALVPSPPAPKWVAMEQHGRNPFVGRSLKVVDYVNNPILWNGALHSFIGLGRHLTVFELDIRRLGNFIGNYPTEIELLRYVRILLENASNLQKLKMYGWYRAQEDDGTIFFPHIVAEIQNDPEILALDGIMQDGGEEEHGVDFRNHPRSSPLPDHANLKVLDLEDLKFKKYYSFTRGVPVEALLVEKYSNQLSCARTNQWFVIPNIYLDWNNLTELHIGLIGCEGILTTLKYIDCPQLSKLSLNVDYNGTNQFALMLDVVNSFPNLQIFRFSFGKNCSSISFSEATTLPLQSLNCISPKLKILEAGYSHRFPFSFLFKFPLIERLHMWDNRHYYDHSYVHKPQETTEILWPLLDNIYERNSEWGRFQNLREFSFKPKKQIVFDYEAGSFTYLNQLDRWVKNKDGSIEFKPRRWYNHKG